MNKHWQEDGADIPTAQLKTWMRGLRGIDPPDGLREKLVAAIPPASARQAGGVYIPRWPKALRYFAAAAVIGIVFVVVRTFVPQTGSPPSLPIPTIAPARPWLTTTTRCRGISTSATTTRSHEQEAASRGSKRPQAGPVLWVLFHKEQQDGGRS